MREACLSPLGMGRVLTMKKLGLFIGALTSLLLSATTVTAAHAAAPGETLSVTVGPPTTVTTVTGSGFAATSVVDLYFDTRQVDFVVTNATGGFTYSLKVPADAAPGNHTVTALAHNGAVGAQQAFLVRSNSPQWHVDAAARGWNKTENTVTTANVSGLDEEWPTGGHPIDTAPVVSGASVFVIGDDGHLRAYDRSTHALKFDVAGANYQSSPAVAGTRVFVAAGGEVQARNSSTGALVWHAPVSLTAGTPTVSNGVVYVVGDGDANAGVYAFSATCGTGGSTCTPLWKGLGGGGGVFGGPLPSVAVGAGRVYAAQGTAGSSSSTLYAYDIGCGTGGATCTPTMQRANVTSQSATFYNNRLYFGTGSTLTVVRPGCIQCQPTWTASLGSTINFDVAAANNQVYVAAGNALHVFPAACGSLSCTELWSTPVNDPTNTTIANGVAYVLTYQNVYAYPTACHSGCTPLWSAGAGGVAGGAYAAVTVADGQLYAPDDIGLHVYSLGGSSTTAQRTAPRLTSLRPSPRFAAAERRVTSRLANG